MPLPVILGIPWLAGVVGGVFTSLFTFLAQHLTKKVAVIGAVIALVVAATTAFVLVIEGLMASIYIAFPAVGPVGLFVPSNISTCISAMVTAKVAHWAYGWNIRVIQYKLNI
jgi:hypothetical protein